MDLEVPDEQAIPMLQAGNYERRRWERVLLGFATALIIVLLVITVALEIQVQTRNGRLDKLDNKIDQLNITVGRLDASSKLALAASKGAKKAVDDALTASAGSGSPTGPEIAAALRAIARIEAELKALTGKP